MHFYPPKHKHPIYKVTDEQVEYDFDGQVATVLNTPIWVFLRQYES